MVEWTWRHRDRRDEQSDVLEAAMTPHVPVAGDYIRARRVGAAQVTLVSEGILPFAPRLPVPEATWRAAMPEADEQGRIPLGINVLHLRLGDVSLLIDPGMDDPASEWQAQLSAQVPGLVRSPGLGVALVALEITPEEITHVLITHAHDDHYCATTLERNDQDVPRFPRARCLLGRSDWEGNSERDNSEAPLARRLGTLDRAGLLEVVDGPRAVAPGVTMLPAPGESPGHSIVRIHSAGETLYYVGDLFHHHCEIEHPAWVSPGRDAAALQASRLRLLSDAVREQATVVYTHAPFPGWGRIVPVTTGYRWQPT